MRHKLRCVCCNKKLKYLGPERLMGGNLADAVSEHMRGAYGSGHDGEMFLVGICDDCLQKKVDSGVVIRLGPYNLVTGELLSEPTKT